MSWPFFMLDLFNIVIKIYCIDCSYITFVDDSPIFL